MIALAVVTDTYICNVSASAELWVYFDVMVSLSNIFWSQFSLICIIVVTTAYIIYFFVEIICITSSAEFWQQVRTKSGVRINSSEFYLAFNLFEDILLLFLLLLIRIFKRKRNYLLIKW